MTNIELRTLAPEYNAADHATYVSRLSAAVAEPKNKNIALTGRYGVGKSSIIDKFLEVQERNSQKSLRISINTLGPDDGEDLTNRIQKELVKQLVYRAKPGELRTSRFARAPEFTWWRAAIDASVIAVAVVGMLWLFGLRPDRNSFGTDNFVLPMIAFFLLAFMITWAVRWHIGRRKVSQFSTGGASIAFEEKTDSYFDKYLDELVAFFEATEPDLVIFEDLDRFDDPQIFDSLRELNTLINASAHWRDRPYRPLRFVYAIKDSLFEKLGDDQRDKDEATRKQSEEDCTPTSRTTEASDKAKSSNTVDIAAPISSAPSVEKRDTAADAVERANRTKFFEIVIPVVPFLSHSNARDLFLHELKKLNLPKETVINRGLIDIVARHTTDMRLMINIGNEFVVYAERLLWIDEAKRAPGLTPDHLFALVVYKNFHLADFEALPHRGSVLDTLEQSRRDLVQNSITALRTERAELVRGTTGQQKQRELATQLGYRLAVFLEYARLSLTMARTGGSDLDVNTTSEPQFWQPIGQSGTAKMTFHHHSGHRHVVDFDRETLGALFPEVGDAKNWLDSPSASDMDRVAQIDGQISDLRGASFKYLIEDERYTHRDRTFSTIADETLLSQLARDLVAHGYLDRYYAEYSTVFYGNFLGVDVANFFRNSVWPNEMDMQFPFTTEGAVANVLTQAPTDFLHTRSALNIEIVDHLMDGNKELSSSLVDFLTRPNNQDAEQFLKTYFNTPGSRSEKLVSLLAAKPWPRLLSFIASDNMSEADETSIRLLNAALVSAKTADPYKLDDTARALIARLHAEIPALTEPQPEASTDALFSFLTSALPSIPSLRVLSRDLQTQAVNTKQYELNIDNIRAAASLTQAEPISADNLICQPEVWQHCTERVDEYLDLVDGDEHTPWSCTSSEVLTQVINAQYETWTPKQLETFLGASADASALPDITAVERDTWQTVVESLMAIPNVANLTAYTNEIGVDTALSTLLIDSEGDPVTLLGVEDANREQLELLIPHLLNATQVLTPSQRASLAAQLMASPTNPSLDVTDIEPAPDELLATLLQLRLLEDTQATFTHFSTAGWPAIGPALQVSTGAAEFIGPQLVAGNAAVIIRDSRFPEETRRAVLQQLSEFAPTEDQAFLATAATAARSLGVKLSPDVLMLIAPTVADPEDVVWQLRQHGKSLSSDTVMEILGRMPGDFVGFSQASGHEFEIPKTASLTDVLGRLKADGAVAFPRSRPRGRRAIRIA